MKLSKIASNKIKYTKKHSQRKIRHFRLLVMLTFLAIAMTTVITIVSAHLFTEKTKNLRIQSGQVTAQIIADTINTERLEKWLAFGSDLEYVRTKALLDNIYHNSPDLKKIFVFHLTTNDTYVIFDINGTEEEDAPLATSYKISDSLKSKKPDMISGEKIAPTEKKTSNSWIISVYQPVMNKRDRCVAYIRADIDMIDIKEYVTSFTIKVVLFSTIFLIICVIIGVRMSIGYHKADDMEFFIERQKRDKLLIREIVESFAIVIDMKDTYTNGHSSRVAKYTAMLTRELGYDQETIEKYYSIALMHDIGKVCIPDEVLNKPGKLTPEEYELIKSHTERGYEALKNISLMPEVAIGARAHHERPDGKGYPLGLKGDAIPRVAQIIAVADTFDAMYSNRPYRKRMNFEKAVSIIKEVSGTQLAEDVVDAFLRLVEKGKFRDPNDQGGGSTDDISNIRGC
ncbi:MAG: HD-GYP domain-containing protein [Ruminococcus sp.]|uniref:HD-GYP domain-containing protein n=1 Tax=Ruminococcus sp. TaxID=41978 RepID=UPI0025FFA4F8|nr:HD-GYP domain-containing protein [Ruminococcus sp.]MCR5601241.1 HD-GYP domain-containing protein [Ruminococcus sp.]